MKNQYGFRKFNIVIIVLVVIAGFSVQAAQASVKTDRYKNAIIQKLTEKLRVDLSDNNVEVKLNDVRDNEISKSRIEFDGQALAVVRNDKTELPFQFTAKVNPNSRSVENVDYKFVEAESEFAPSMAEDSLMKGLMAQISKDHATTNIVIAIDGFDAARLTSAETKYEGTGEVRIGDFEWHKIKFNVVLDAQSQSATRISYEIQK